MKNTIRLFILLVCLQWSISLSAKHIIGGEVTYVCNGNGSYTFTMDIYRDCASGGAEFDEPAIVSVYREVAAGGYSLLQTLEVGLLSSNAVVPEDDPCMEPLQVCVEKGSYMFTLYIPPGNDDFHIVYQRCCRNVTINNIVDPENSGATYTIELTAEAKQLCNNSPVFNDFPPIVICAGSDINFDHAATDPDGDQLVYSFCSPFLGGGPDGSDQSPGDPNSCVGVAPNPACPPPFDNVNFIAPTYSTSNPMGGNPQITIDPFTGLITGVPDVLGQFVVGVCVEEYRNGQLLSVVRRDFQFNVTSCTPLVDAIIAADEVISDNEFVILSCGDNAVHFDNQSVQLQNIDDFVWNIELPSGTQHPTEWSPTVEYPGTGTYNASLYLNPGTPCADTAFIEVHILPGLNADFSYVYDTCISAPVVFTDLSTTESGTMTNWDWNFGDGNTSTEVNPEHLYMVPGNLPVTLVVTDINGCKDTAVQVIPYYPVPSILVIEPTTFYGCEPLEVLFNNLSFPIDSTYDVIWTFGDGTTANEVSPLHVYEEGIYSVSVDVTSPIGCQTDASWDDWVTVLGSPIAGFSYTPDKLTNFNSTATFEDASIDAVAWQWLFDEDGTSTVQNPVFTFPDTGLQVVQQIVFHESGCTDTAALTIDVVPEIRYFLPNAFTPNFDALNDLFMGAGYFDGITEFNMTIWNRWGERIFQTHDPNTGWNGRKNNVGELVQQGVYVYVVRFLAPRGQVYHLNGFATLLR